MARFSFYSPGETLDVLEAQASDLRVYGVELDETFLEVSGQSLLRAHYESGLQYVCLHLNNDLEQYSEESLQRAGVFCETNFIEAIVFDKPGASREKAEKALDILSCFRIKIVFENRNGSFLSSPDDMEMFFRNNWEAQLCYNPADMAVQRLHPFLEALNGKTYHRNLFMVRVYEVRFNGDNVLPIDGDAELAEIFSSAAGFGRDVWASLIPYGGFSHAERKAAMTRALIRI